MEQAVATAAQLGQWSPVGPYLDTASFGLPPQSAFDALQQALADWATLTSTKSMPCSTRSTSWPSGAVVTVTPRSKWAAHG